MCVCVAVFFSGIKLESSLLFITLAQNGERIKEATMSYNLKKATLYLCPSGVLLARNAITSSFWIPPPQLKKFVLTMKEYILAWGDDRHDVEVGRIKKDSIC